jgi:hypothetical protein
MENKSLTKKYLFAGIILVLVIIIVVLLMGRLKPAPQITQIPNTPSPIANTPAAPANTSSTPAENTPAAPTTPVTNTAAAEGLIGTWNSSVPGKGMEGSGKVTLNGIVFQLNLAGGVNLVIQKVENNTGTGTITFDNVCVTGTKTVAGKPATAFSPQCEKTYSRPALMQIDGNKISWSGKSDLGADISLNGTFTGDTMSGTFVRTSTSGTINGTFSLTRAKN